jgi:hypothetical protein
MLLSPCAEALAHGNHEPKLPKIDGLGSGSGLSVEDIDSCRSIPNLGDMKEYSVGDLSCSVSSKTGIVSKSIAVDV